MGLTQQEFADKLNVSVRTISRWEAGWKIPKKYAKALSFQRNSVDKRVRGSRIREYRIKAGIEQKELGEKVGCSESCICKIETGVNDPRLSLFVAICEILNISADDIIWD